MSSSKKVFEAIEAGDWVEVKEIIMATSWTTADLEATRGLQWVHIN